jgi:hypothetical protein
MFGRAAPTGGRWPDDALKKFCGTAAELPMCRPVAPRHLLLKRHFDKEIEQKRRASAERPEDLSNCSFTSNHDFWLNAH